MQVHKKSEVTYDTQVSKFISISKQKRKVPQNKNNNKFF